MSDFWEAQLENLQPISEIFFKLTSATEGGDSSATDYKLLRASRLQLRFAQDLVTVIQFFLEKEKELYVRDHASSTIRHGHLVHRFADLTNRSAESLAISASQADASRLSAVVRKLGFGEADRLQ